MIGHAGIAAKRGEINRLKLIKATVTAYQMFAWQLYWFIKYVLQLPYSKSSSPQTLGARNLVAMRGVEDL